MPNINSVSEQMLMDGPDGAGIRCPGRLQRRFWPGNRNPWSSSTRTTRKGERRNFPTVSASIPPLLLLLLLLLLQHILQEMPALKCSLISGFTRSEWSWCRPAAALQTLCEAGFHTGQKEFQPISRVIWCHSVCSPPAEQWSY